MKIVFLSLVIVLFSSLAFADAANQKVMPANQNDMIGWVDVAKAADNITNGLLINESVLKAFGICYVTIDIFNEDGDLVERFIRKFESPNINTQADCDGIAQAVVDFVKANS